MIKRIFVLLIIIVITSFSICGCITTDVSNSQQEINKQDKEDTENNKSEILKDMNEIIMCENSDFNTGFSTASFHESKGFSHYLTNIYETLVNYENGEIVPGLAESWKVDGNEITFNLRKDVKFSDGTVLNAESVKKNFETIPIIMGYNSATFATLDKLESIKIIDEYTVKFTMEQPYVGALQEFTTVHTHGIMSTKAFTDNGLSDDINSKTFGTGPYILDNFIEGQSYTFIRNDSYWGKIPVVKKFTVKIIPDMGTRIMALKSGEVDIIVGANNITYDSFFSLKKDSNFNVKVSENDVYGRTLLLNTTKEPFDNKNVRLALAYAIDAQEICDNVFYGIEDRAKTHLSSQLPYCDVDFKSYTYNIEKAKKLLDKAEYIDRDGDGIREKNGQKLEVELLYKAGLSINKDFSLTIAGQLKEVGFDIKVNGLDVMAWYTKGCEGGGSILIYETMGMPFDPFISIQTMSKLTSNPDNAYLTGLLQYPELNSKLVELTTTGDKSYAQEIFDYVLTTVHEEAVYVPISYTKELAIFNKNIISDYKFNGQPAYIDVTGIILNK